LVNCPLAASAVSPAGLYRTIELFSPTLLIGEVDCFLKGDEQLRGLVNSGHTKDAAFYIACVKAGDDYEPRRWSTWAPKIFAGIGRIAGTIEDRAIIAKMARKRRTKLSRNSAALCGLMTSGVCHRWAADHAEEIRAADPTVPEESQRPAADIRVVLLALADSAGVGDAGAMVSHRTLCGEADTHGDGA
jgi:putative DNA primase/helicase